MTVSSLFKRKKKNSQQKKTGENAKGASSQESTSGLNDACTSSSCEDLANIYTIPDELEPEVVKEPKVQSRWKKNNEDTNSIFFQSIMRSTREPQFGPLYNVVQSMIHPSELKGIPVEKCRAPPTSDQWYHIPKKTSNVVPKSECKCEDRPPTRCSSTSSSVIDFDKVEFDKVVRTPEPPKLPKIFGFDRYGNKIEEEYLPDIIYAFGDVKENVHNGRQLEKYVENVEKIELLELAGRVAKSRLPKNPDKVPKNNRETAEGYMKNVCERKIKDEDDVEPPKVSSVENRIRRKISFGSYPNNSVDENELPRLLRYTWKGKLMKLRKYLKDKYNQQKINKRDSQGRTALHFAASWGCEKTVRLLLSVPGIYINPQDNDGKTPIFKAVEVNDFKTVKLLVDVGSKIDRPALDGRNPFEYALQELGDKHFEMIMYMYCEGDMHRLRKEDGKMTYLHLLCLSKRTVKVKAIMEEMIKCREFVNTTEGQGRTPLILATQMNRPDIVKVLLDNSADVKHIDLNLKAAIQYVKANTDCYKLLRAALNRLPQPKPKKMKKKNRDSKGQEGNSQQHRIRAKSPF